MRLTTWYIHNLRKRSQSDIFGDVSTGDTSGVVSTGLVGSVSS